ncbi:8381_t:CDS:1 [Ambispora leptoticha]|uniref:8381_t:CDS:1 n=1 Tax=Ambispora leptoticha TaxID=144679 RepID=A0A9N9FZ17_9GLOM|nr:8381_t:CDS:1 [Ambispora leptoticha]
MRSYKLLVFGDSGVGKKSLTVQFCKNYFLESHESIFENSYRKDVMIDDEPCSLEIIINTAEQEEYADISGIRDYDGFLLVYSITSRTTFERVEIFLNQIKQNTDSAPIVIVGNKCDKMIEREVSRDEGKRMAQILGCEVMESSAKTCVNVEKAFHNVVKTIRVTREGARNPKRQKRCSIL